MALIGNPGLKVLSSNPYGLGAVKAVSFDPRVDRLIVAGENGFGTWDVSAPEQPRQIGKLVPSLDTIRDAVVAPDRPMLVTATEAGIAWWNLERGTLLDQHKFPEPNALAFSADGSQLAAGSFKGVLATFDDRMNATDQWTALSGNILDVAFLPDGRLLAAGQAPEMTIWRDANTSVPLRLAGGMSFAYAVAAFPKGDRIAVGGGNQSPVLLVRSTDPLSAARGQETKTEFRPSALSGGRSGELFWGDVGGELHHRTVKIPSRNSGISVGSPVTALAHSTDGTRIAYGTQSGVTAILAPDGSVEPVARGGRAIRGLAFVAGGLAVLDSDGIVRIYKGSGKIHEIDPADDRILSIAAGPANGTLLVGRAKGDVELLILYEEGRHHRASRMPGRSGVSSLAVSQEGLIGVGREDGNVMFTNWQGDKLAPPKQVRAGVGAVRSLSFSPSGGHALATTGAATITLISTRAGAMHSVGDVPGPGAEVTMATFIDAGDIFAAASYDGKIMFGDVAELVAIDAQLIRSACAAVAGQMAVQQWFVHQGNPWRDSNSCKDVD
ncbi:hypothetical protein JCM9533A_42380 [Catenuloplanes niger JCM 9533]